MTCNGAGTEAGDHCCYVAGERCSHLVENVAGRRFACTLMLEFGSWDLVHIDPRYAPIQAAWDETGSVESCGAWGPGTGQCCYAEVM